MNATTVTPIYQIGIQKEEVFKNICLDGVKTLKADKITTIFEVKYKLHPKTQKPVNQISKKQVDEIVEHLSFNLFEVTSEELAGYRRSEDPAFVLKVDGKLYYSIIPDNMSFLMSPILGNHQCSSLGCSCRRISAAPDEAGGCAKVRDYAQCIERYPWITTGYETFNTRHDSFVVVNCLHYEKSLPHKQKKQNLADFIN